MTASRASGQSEPAVLRQWLGYMTQLLSIFELDECGPEKAPVKLPQSGPKQNSGRAGSVVKD